MDSIILVFTSKSYTFLHNMLKRHKAFLYKLHPVLQKELILDINQITSVLRQAEKAGKKKEVHNGQSQG